MQRREGGGEAMVRGEEAVATADEMMGEAEGGRRRRRARRRSASGGRGRTPHPCQRRRRRCRHRRHPPSRRRTSREVCRRPSTPTSTPSPLPRKTSSTRTTTGPRWRGDTHAGYNGWRQCEGGDRPCIDVVDATCINSIITSNEYIFFLVLMMYTCRIAC